MSEAGPADVEEAVESGLRVAGRGGVWQGVRPAARSQLVLHLANLLQRDSEHLAGLVTLETGTPLHKSRAEVRG